MPSTIVQCNDVWNVFFYVCWKKKKKEKKKKSSFKIKGIEWSNVTKKGNDK